MDGWYRFAYLAGLLIATLITVGVNLSPNATGYSAFVQSAIFIPWTMFFLEWIVHYSTGISIFPFGSKDDDTYLFQKFFGYNGAVAIAIIGGLIMAGFFAWTVTAYKVTWMPISNMLAPASGFNAASQTAVDFFSGTNPFWRAVIDGVVPTFFENPLLIYSTVFLLWIVPRYLLKFLGVPDLVANISGFFVWLGLSGMIFSYTYHAFVYQAVEPLYVRAYSFVIANGILVGLTGIPFPMDISHFANNFFGSYFGIVSWGMIIACAPLMARSEKLNYHANKILTRVSKIKPSWFPERGFIRTWIKK